MTNSTARATKDDLGRAVATRLGTTIPDGIAAVDAVLDAITQALAGGQSVMVSNFGTFTHYERPARAFRNPQTGSQVEVPRVPEVRFRVSSGLRATVRTADPDSATIRKAPQAVRTVQGEVAGQ